MRLLLAVYPGNFIVDGEEVKIGICKNNFVVLVILNNLLGLQFYTGINPIE